MIQWVQPRLLRDLGRFYKCFLVFAWQYGGLQFGIYEVYLIQERLSSKGEKENSVE